MKQLIGNEYRQQASSLHFRALNLKACRGRIPSQGHRRVPSPLKPSPPPLLGDNELEGNDYTALINFPRPFSRLRSRSTIIGPYPRAGRIAACRNRVCLSLDESAAATTYQSAKFLFNDSL